MNISQICHAYEAGRLSTVEAVRALERQAGLHSRHALSEGQKGLWALHRMEPDMRAYHVPIGIRCAAGLDADRLQRAFVHVLRQNPLLTARVSEKEARPCFDFQDPSAFCLAQENIDDGSDADLAERLRWHVAQPFRLEAGPLIRLTLISGKEVGTILLIVAHHMVLDGTSSVLLLTQLLETYSGFLQGTPPVMTVPPATYDDFVRWEQDWLTSDAAQQARTYWLAQLAGTPPLQGMPVEKPWTPAHGHRGKVLRRPMPAALAGAIEQFAAAQGISKSVLLLGAFRILLFRYTGQPDIAIGMPVIGRPQARFDGVMGHFINMLPIRVAMEAEGEAQDFLKALQQAVLDAIDHAPYPFARQVNDQNARDVNLSAPLFQTSFNYQSFAQPDWLNALKSRVAPSVSFEVLEELVQAGEYELCLEVLPAEGMALCFKYHPDLYSDDTISRLADHYLHVVQALVGASAARLGQWPLIDAGERQRLLDLGHLAAHEWPDAHSNVYDLFLKQVKARPGAPAVSHGDTTLSYRQLDEACQGVADALKARGVGPDTRVGLCALRSIDMLVGLLAIVRAGASYIPLDPDYPVERLTHMVEDGDCRVILTQRALRDKLKDICPQAPVDTVFFEDIQAPPAGGKSPARSRSGVKGRTAKARATSTTALAYTMYTSGSTGKPKGVMIPHRALTNFLLSMREKLAFGERDSLLAVTTYSFDIAGLELYLPLISGGHCVICDAEVTRDAARLKQTLAEVRPTMMQATPMTWHMLFRVGWRNEERVRLLCGGEAMTDSLKRLFMERQCDVWNMYGPTETTIWSTMQHVREDRPVSIGNPIHNTRVYILDNDLEPVPVGVPGELLIAGDGVALGYHKRLELTAEKFISSPFDPAQLLYRTGDLARWRADGEIDVIGRIDHQVKVNGFRIELGEIEKTLNAHPGVENSAVVLHAGPGLDRLTGYYVTRNATQSAGGSVDARTLQAHLRMTLPEYMIPGDLIAIPAFPLTPNGKIDRSRLMPPAAAAWPEAASDRPAAALQARVRGIFMEVLERGHIERDDRFFDVGGNSMTAILVVEKINETFGCRIGVTDLFKYPTAEAIGRLVQRLRGVGDDASDAPAQHHDDATPETRAAHDAQLAEIPRDAVAIIGMSCQFPGAKDHRAYWQNLLNGQDGIRFVPPDELRRWGIDEALIANPDFVPQQASIDGKDLFDPAFFNISPRDAAFMDPQARLLLMHAWNAVEDAGYDVDDIPETSVFMAAGNNFYQAQWAELVSGTTRIRIMQSADEYVAWILAQGGSLPTMVSNKLGMKGPSVYVSTNCSSSLTGLHLACQGLATHEVDQALVGAAAVFPAESLGYVHQPGLNFASAGHCRAFDAGADGMVGGEGVAVVMLKRAIDAVRDGDAIYALIRGTAINNDGGEKAGFYAPSIQGQTAVIQKVLDKTGIDPATICYVEAHGTGTKIGDPIEVTGLTEAYRRYTDKRQFCAIGSVKSNIGHLDAAAGLAGLIKLALGLRHGEIPRTLHFDRPNPDIDFASSPFYVLTRNMRLDETSPQPARAALSSFGIGGTNTHAVLEQYRPASAKAGTSDMDESGLLVLSARNAQRLRERAEALLGVLVPYREQGGRLTDLLHTLQIGRKPMACRVAFPVEDLDALARKLSDYLSGDRVVPGIAEGDAKTGDQGLNALFDSSEEAEQWTRNCLEKRQWQKLGTLWAHGVPVDWRALYAGRTRRRVHLPGYPFARKSYWLQQANAKPQANGPVNDVSRQMEEAAMRALTRMSGSAGAHAMLEDRQRRMAQLDHILGRLLLTQLMEAGLFGEGAACTLSGIDRILGLSEAHRRWMARSLELLSQAGHLHASEDSYALAANQADEDAWSVWHRFKDARGGTPETPGRVPLLEAMLHALPQIIAGRVPATQVMFPDASHALVEGVYKHNAAADYFNGLAADAADAYIRSLLAQTPQSRIRILEIGAGTGSTSEHMFRRLSELAPNIAEYVYTDLSKAFLVQAESRFGADVPYLRYRAFDVEKAPGPQGIALASFDVVIATNVLHATRDMRRTLAHAKALLRTDGLLLVNEIVENDLTMHLTFGLLEGWWKYDDSEQRLPGGPALSASTWRDLLVEAGFRNVQLPAACAESLGLQLIMGQSDGRDAGMQSSTRMHARSPERGQPAVHPIAVEPVISRIASGGTASRPANTAHSVDVRALETRVADALVSQLAASLQLDMDDIRPDESFSDYGLDSLTGVDLVKQLNQSLGIRLDVTRLFDFPTVNTLKAHIVSSFGDALSQAAPMHAVKSDRAFSDEDEARSTRLLSNASDEGAVGESADKSAIAIIGLSGRFPQTDDLDTFWDHLANGRDLVEPVERWDLSPYNAQCRAGGFLRDIAHFDPLFFNISGLEAAYMEPQQRIFLEETWKALEDAGYAGDVMDQRRCGVYVGCTNGDYIDLGSQAVYPAQAFWGNMSSIIPSRISYYLNLHGPALAIDTACSSSLVAIHLACQGLRGGEVDMALAGGVFVQCSPRLYIAGTRAGMLSPTGRCRSFDDGADGFVPAEGAGALVLKRLGDALADGDHIHGVIRGSGINQDGTTNGISAPSAISQQRLEEQVYAQFGIDCESIQMLEAHGTGTKLGDPIEFQALTRAFRGQTDKQGFCALGSSKANIGHAQMAAGVIGVIKILLAIRHRQIPPLALFQRTNANIVLEGSPFYVNTDLIPWNPGQGVRRAAISSFGASGTNAHMVIEEAPDMPKRPTPVRQRLCVLSARTAPQLRRQAEQLRRHCQARSDAIDLADMSYTLLVGRKHFDRRLAIVAETVEDVCAHLAGWLAGGAVDRSMVFESASDASRKTQRILQASAVSAETPVQARTLVELAASFSSGQKIDAAMLFADGGYRRISLPTYPFDREYHWAEDKVLVGAAPAPAVKDEALTLRQTTISGAGGADFDAALNGQAFYLRDHKVLGRSILPASVYLELARLAARQLPASAARSGFGLKNLVLLRPLSDTDHPVRVAITGDTPPSFEVRSADVDTTDAGSLHCRGELAPDPAASPAPLDLSRLQAHGAAQDMAHFYSDFARMGIDYGPAFQGVRAVYTHPDGVLARLALPAHVGHTLQDMAIHPTMVDCAMQCLKWLPDTQAAGQQARLMFAIKEVRMHAPCTASMWAWIRHAPATGGPGPRKIDVDMSDEQGRICLSIRGISTRAAAADNATAGRAAPMPMAGGPVSPMAATRQAATIPGAVTLLPVWEPTPEAARARWPSVTDRVAIIGGGKRIQETWRNAFPDLLAIEAGQIARWQASTAPLDHVIWVAPEPMPGAAPPDADQVIEDQAQGAIAVWRLMKALLASGYGRQPLGLTIITRGSLASHPLEPCDPTHAGIGGLMGAVAKEYPNWCIRVVDLHDKDFDAAGLQALLMRAPERDGNTLLYRQRQWFSQRLLPLSVAPAAGSAFRQEGVYVIVGGAGGLGRAISAYLIRRYQARIVWLGRSPADAGIDAHIAALSAEGPAPCYLQADATDAASLSRAREEIARRFGPVHGLIQSALVLEGASIERMSERQFTDVLRAKVDVSMRLIQAFSRDPLDLVLFVSSINAYLKAMGQGNYAAACTFKDSLALRLAQTLPCAVKVINLGYCFNNADSDPAPGAADRKDMDFIGRDELMAGLETLCASRLPQMTLMKFSLAQNTRGIVVGAEQAQAQSGGPASRRQGGSSRPHSGSPHQGSVADASTHDTSAEDLARIIERMKALNALAI